MTHRTWSIDSVAGRGRCGISYTQVSGTAGSRHGRQTGLITELPRTTRKTVRLIHQLLVGVVCTYRNKVNIWYHRIFSGVEKSYFSFFNQ